MEKSNGQLGALRCILVTYDDKDDECYFPWASGAQDTMALFTTNYHLGVGYPSYY